MLSACSAGSGGAKDAAGGESLLEGTLVLLGVSPDDGAVQVPPDAEIRISFDSRVVLESLADEDTWLRVGGTATEVEGTFRLENQNRTAVFTPASSLAPETDYELQVSPLTCDESGRILERTFRSSFRTEDHSPPSVAEVSFAPGQTGVSRTDPILVRFSEDIDPATVTANSVYLRDSFGATYPTEAAVDGADLSVRPIADLPGDRPFVLAITTAIADRSGNRMADGFTRGMRTEQDTDGPEVSSFWPPPGSVDVSPRVQPVFWFDESMDPGSVEPTSVLFQDEFGSMVPYRVHASADQRSLRLEPLFSLRPGRRYTIAFLLGIAAAADVSGNPLESTLALVFTTGSDSAPPSLVSSLPSQGQAPVSVNAVAELTFDEPLDPAFVDSQRVQLLRDGTPLPAVVELDSGERAVRLTPILPLPVASTLRLRALGGHDGLRDKAGNPLPEDIVIRFTTAGDSSVPGFAIQPPDGSVSTPLGAAISIVFDAPMDPASLSPSSVAVADSSGRLVDGTLRLLQGDRVARFVPANPWSAGAHYRITVRGGPEGVRGANGNWLAEDRASEFRAGFSFDSAPPTCDVTLNGIAAQRRNGLVLPPSGFTIDVSAADPAGASLDMGTIAVQLSGPGAAPSSDAIYRDAKVDATAGALHYRVPSSAALAPGRWTALVAVADLSGNRSPVASIEFEVASPTAEILPFERTQVVWLRTDIDRSGNGIPDFDDDLMLLGLEASGDPSGTNAFTRKLVLDAIVAEANSLLHRGENGEPLGPDSVPLRFTTREPIGLAHMQMALGGLDPTGDPHRHFGDPSTGILGRALYDYRNSTVNERNTMQSPGLGVFPAELYLFQARIHSQVYPSFTTMFGQRFLPLSPDLGGTPAGAGPDDAAVLSRSFDYASATSSQRARYNAILSAADDWATAIGIIVAHEVGHSVGLVAPGDAPSGLFGDASLHDTEASAAEVMASAVGYEAMLTLDYAFRDSDLAYLRQRILVR
ncbi:MAG: hypothetical protein Fur0037_24670 [Planctomycetota bacterium]